MRKTYRLPKGVKGNAPIIANARSPHRFGITVTGCHRPNPNNVDKYSPASQWLWYSPDVIFPIRIQREGSRFRYGKPYKGNTGVALEILLLAQFLKRSSSGSEVPARGIPPPCFSPRIFARPPCSILRVPGERRYGTRCAFRIATPPRRRPATPVGFMYLLARYVYYLVYHAVLHTLLAAWRHCSENQEMCHRQRG